jgi:hypothetical protein
VVEGLQQLFSSCQMGKGSDIGAFNGRGVGVLRFKIVFFNFLSNPSSFDFFIAHQKLNVCMA